MIEIFKDIEGYEGLYQISNYGNVKSLNFNRTGKEKILKPTKNSDGYLQICLHKQGIKKHYIHRLVAQAFIENPNNLPQVNHKDEDKTNNYIENLEWCERKYNINYGTRTDKCSKQVLCVETGVVYPSTIEVERQLGFNNANIGKCCNGRYKQAYGYTWCYV